QGTSVQVQDLFYNTPARRKFLRSERTEFKHIDDVVRRLALSHFETAFKLQHNGRLVFHLSPALNEQQRQQRIARLCGKDFLRHAVQLDFTAHGLRLSGWLTQPEFSRSQNDLQHFFINGRMIRDRLITHAIHQVYQEILLPGRFPGFVLDLEIDHGSVDVNVHPTKHEVRFNEARMVHDFIYMSCKNALASKPESFSINEPMQEYAGEQAYTPVWRTHSVNSHNSASISKESERMSLPLGDVIGVVHERFLLAQNQTGLVMVNLGKAREKLLKNKMRYDFDNNTIVSQPLLVPTTVSVPSTLAECCEHYADFISSLGFELGRSGPESVMLRMMPALFRDASIEQLVMQLLESTHALDTKDFSEADAHRVLQTLLHSIKESFSAWSTTQLDQLLREIEALSDPTLWCCLDDEQLQTLINPAELSKPKN
ncbi:MAG: DNA mismatch repair endonuclease MutL, partial [Gammaproteobacteria bacterium]|nr:DNA mismatch repair endonuclease MutL [Gammaproteobacteria bacterium]